MAPWPPYLRGSVKPFTFARVIALELPLRKSFISDLPMSDGDQKSLGLLSPPGASRSRNTTMRSHPLEHSHRFVDEFSKVRSIME